MNVVSVSHHELEDDTGSTLAVSVTITAANYQVIDIVSVNKANKARKRSL